jgi:hypothetical protein
METTSHAPSTEGVSRYTASFGLSLIVACIFNALLVVIKEKSPATMAWMKKTSGHHWATHTLLSLAVFIGLGLILAKANKGKGTTCNAKSLAGFMIGSVILGAVIISGYYLFLD